MRQEPGRGRSREEGAGLPARRLPRGHRLPAARWPGGRWLPRARRTVTCRGDTARAPSPAGEVDPAGGAVLGCFSATGAPSRRAREGGTPRRKPAVPAVSPNPVSGVQLREPRKTSPRATCAKSGYWACAVFPQKCDCFPGFPRRWERQAGGGAGRGRAASSLADGRSPGLRHPVWGVILLV